MFMKDDLGYLAARACEVVEKTGSFIRQELGRVGADKVEEKSLHSLVSYVDRSAEEQLVQGLGALLPEATFLTEEETVQTRKGNLQWIIDPLDGTTNFLHQLPCFAISVALREGERTVLGIVYEVNRPEMFYAWAGGGAFLNGRPIRVSATAQMKDALLATGFPYYDFGRMDAYLGVLKDLMRETRGIRRLGSAAVDLAYVACGRFDGFFEYSLHPWDVAAGALLVEEAGGRVTDFSGGDNYLFGKEIVAVNQGISGALAGALSRAF